MPPPLPPLRIASLQPSITLTLEKLGALDMLVACTKYCVEAVPQLRTRPITVIADAWSTTAEGLLATRPNLVLASAPYRMETLAAILKAACPVLTLAPHHLAGIYQDIRMLASIVGAPGRGAGLIAFMQQAIDGVRLAVAPQTQRPRVYCEEWGNPLIHSQPWVQELVEAAGGVFVGEAGKKTSAGAVAAADPDVLLFAWCGAGDRVPLERVVEKRGWQGLRAVRDRRVFCVPDEHLNTPAHTLLEGLACLSAAIHPEIFPSHPRLRPLRPSHEGAEGPIL
ncbi:MAG: ABC transporter substrate-binding protein [Acidobacteriaceae bacterium]